MLKKSLIIFMTEVILFWALWFIYGFIWRNGDSGTAQILEILSYIFMGLSIITAIITFIIILHESSNGIRALHVILFVIFIVLHLALYILFSDIGKTTGGSFIVGEKIVENGKYYISIQKENEDKNITIECSFDDYNKINLEDETSYSFSYRWLKILPAQGVMERDSFK